jgi:HlyD family secretion protein
MSDTPDIAESSEVFATGFIEAARDADLVFQVNGQVGEVLVEEGEQVEEGELLAILDTRRFDQEVRNAEAALISARADQLSLVEDPQPERVRAAQAAVEQASGQLSQAQGRVTEQDIAAARANLEEARASLADVEDGADELDVAQARSQYQQAQISMEATRDQLSHAKTQADIQVQQAAEGVRQAQVDYSAAYWDWRYVRDHGKAPPRTVQEEQLGPTLTDQSEQTYRNRLEQAELALEQSHDRLDSAQTSLEEARLREITGVEEAEERVQQARIQLEQVQEPPENNEVAAAQARVANAEANLQRLLGLQRAGELEAAQAGLNQAQANLEQLYSEPTESQSIRAEAGIARAEASLEQARLNREYAEIRAPFSGEVATINIDPGDPGTTGGPGSEPAIRLVDMASLRVEVDVTDADIAQVEVGQSAEVVADAMPGRVFEGEVTFISPTANTGPQGVTTYAVRIAFDEETVPLRVGMSVSVTIMVGDDEAGDDEAGDDEGGGDE